MYPSQLHIIYNIRVVLTFFASIAPLDTPLTEHRYCRCTSRACVWVYVPHIPSSMMFYSSLATLKHAAVSVLSLVNLQPTFQILLADLKDTDLATAVRESVPHGINAVSF